MNSILFSSFLVISLLFHAQAAVQTGFINLNSLVKDNEPLNQHSSTLCYVEKFSYAFKTVPQVSTSLVAFDMDCQNRNNYQLQVRVVKKETTETSANFLFLARRQLGFWNKVSFLYLADDQSDILSSFYTAGNNQCDLETIDLSGCGKSLEQQFQVPVQKNQWKDPLIRIFITGFDMSTTDQYRKIAKFQVNISQVHYKDTLLTVAISRSSPIQVYSVSFTYVILNKHASTLQYYDKTDSSVFKQTTHKQLTHNLQLFRGAQFYGISKFAFSDNEQFKRNLLIQFTDLLIKYGSNSKLENMEVSYLIIREKLSCQKDQIAKWDEVSKKNICAKCDATKRFIPNHQKNQCVCIANHFIWKEKCYPIPENSIFNEKQATYVCQQGYSWIYFTKNDQIYCRVPPQNSYWNTQIQRFQCNLGFYIIDGKCLKPSENEFFDVKTKTFACIKGFERVQKLCVKPKQNEVWSTVLYSFVCVNGAYRIGQLCLFPPQNMTYNHETKSFACLQGCYPIGDSKCAIVPKDRHWSAGEKRLKCNTGLFEIDYHCKVCPENEKYDESNKNFICNDGFFRLGATGICQKPSENQIYEQKSKTFVCRDGCFRVNNLCKEAFENSYYCEIAHDFVCKQGFYLVSQGKGSSVVCLKAPKNQYYDEKSKTFICLKGFYRGDANSCVQIPQFKAYSVSLQRLVCIDNYFELTDGSCQKPGQNQIYEETKKIFVCKQGNYRIGNFCRNLPQNCRYVSQNYSIQCKEGFYKTETGLECRACQKGCEQCSAQNKCTKCPSGFKISVSNQGSCQEICGDGLKFNLACDDGNNKNGDGCSSECVVEDGWKCKGGSQKSPDVCKKQQQQKHNLKEEVKCQQKKSLQATQLSLVQQNLAPLEIRMVGLSHLYGKIVVNVKLGFVPGELLASKQDLKIMFRVLTNSKIPLTVNAMYIDKTTYTFVILYDFNNVEPIPEFLTRVQLSKEISQKYYRSTDVKPLFVKINPALMAQHDDDSNDRLKI